MGKNIIQMDNYLENNNADTTRISQLLQYHILYGNINVFF
jgi:hypothetical protein